MHVTVRAKDDGGLEDWQVPGQFPRPTTRATTSPSQSVVMPDAVTAVDDEATLPEDPDPDPWLDRRPRQRHRVLMVRPSRMSPRGRSGWSRSPRTACPCSTQPDPDAERERHLHLHARRRRRIGRYGHGRRHDHARQRRPVAGDDVRDGADQRSAPRPSTSSPTTPTSMATRSHHRDEHEPEGHRDDHGRRDGR